MSESFALSATADAKDEDGAATSLGWLSTCSSDDSCEVLLNDVVVLMVVLREIEVVVLLNDSLLELSK